MTRSRDKRRKALKDKDQLANVKVIILNKHGLAISTKTAQALINGVKENGN